MEKCKWRVPNLFKGDPDKVKQEIDMLGDAVKPADLVLFASNPDTELHKCFEWDDTEAARKYRLHQASEVMRSLVVEVVSEKKEASYVRVRYVTKSGEGYKPTELIMKDKDEYEKLLERAKAEFRAFHKKYKSLQEFQDIFEVANMIL